MNASAMAFALFLANLNNPSLPSEAGVSNSEPRSYQVAYSNTLVDFSIHNQEIIQDSVCQNSSQISKQQALDCQTHARLLFSETCKQLSNSSDSQAHAYKETFCQSAYTMQQGGQGIGLVSNKKEAPAFLARQQCSEYTLRAQRTGSGAHIEIRDRACKKARRLSKNQNHQQLAGHI